MSDSAIAGIDHVTTVLEILEAPKLFAALTALGLVVAWRYADYGSFASGGVRLGNVNLEIIGVAGGPHNEWPPRCVTLAPLGLSGLEAALDRRGVAHGKRQPLMLGGSREPLYTTISLPELGGTGFAVQLCAYARPSRADTGASADRLGVVDVERVVLAVRDAAGMRQRWAALLAPVESGPDGVWRFRQGPALELRTAEEDVELVVRVRSIASVRTALSAVGLAVSGDAVQIGTLTVRLTAAPTGGTPPG